MRSGSTTECLPSIRARAGRKKGSPHTHHSILSHAPLTAPGFSEAERRRERAIPLAFVEAHKSSVRKRRPQLSSAGDRGTVKGITMLHTPTLRDDILSATLDLLVVGIVLVDGECRI